MWVESVADDAVYGRTARGQRELVNPARGLTPWERRFLGCATGFTPLRTLLDLGLDAPEAVSGIRRLLSEGLIENVGQRPGGVPTDRPAGGARGTGDAQRH